jgi:hypothetical protein
LSQGLKIAHRVAAEYEPCEAAPYVFNPTPMEVIEICIRLLNPKHQNVTHYHFLNLLAMHELKKHLVARLKKSDDLRVTGLHGNGVVIIQIKSNRVLVQRISVPSKARKFFKSTNIFQTHDRNNIKAPFSNI